MRIATGLFVLLALLSSAWATPDDLSGGVFIAHYVPEVIYTHDPPMDACEAYAPYAITSCAQQCTRVDTDSMRTIVWYVLCAWTEEKEFWGAEIGVGEYSEDMFLYIAWDVCFPPSGGLVIPAGHFPGPNEGTAFVATGEPWQGNYVPVLWVAGHAYAESGVIQLSVDPPTGWAGWWTDGPDPRSYPTAAFGALGINADGLPVCPGDPLAVCCLPGDTCWLLSAYQNCEMLGGVWHANWTTCEPNPCGETPARMSTWGELKKVFR